MRTYGNVVLAEDRWVIDCEPHVLIRLKRHFGKVGNRPGRAVVSNNDENARELEWFLQRYPMEVTPLDELTRRADAHRTTAEQIQNVLFGHYIPASINELAVPAREYQKLAAALLLTNRGLLVADDVGLGKTVTAIATFTDPRTLPVLVVTLTHLPRQWEAMLNRFAPQLRVHILKGTKAYDLAERFTKEAKRRRLYVHGTEKTLQSGFPDVLITNYHKLFGWADALSGVAKHVVFDEIQELRHNGSFKFTAAQQIAHACEFRMGLSATPIYNYGGEMFNVLDTLHPGKLGTRAEFLREWCGGFESSGFRPDDKAKIKNPKAFGVYTRDEGLMIRRTREEVRRELPPVENVMHLIDADMAALDRVGAAAAELARIIVARNESYRGQIMRASEELTNILRQATGVAKAPFVADFVRLLVEQGEPVLLYGWHREVYGIWLDRLADLNPVMYTGSESVPQKAEAVRAFTSGEAKVLIMSLRAGAGVDGLQEACRVVVFGELDWSPGVHEQCRGRIHRDGQDEPVLAYFLVSEFGADPVIVDTLGLKRQQSQGIRDPNADLVSELQRDDDHINRLAREYLKQRGLSTATDADVNAAATLGITLGELPTTGAPNV